jgi:hypothetical protein
LQQRRGLPQLDKREGDQRTDADCGEGERDRGTPAESFAEAEGEQDAGEGEQGKGETEPVEARTDLPRLFLEKPVGAPAG